MSGTYQNESWSTSAANGNSDNKDMTTDGTNIWIVDGDKYVYKYDMSGNYVSKWDTSTQTTSPAGIANDGTNFYITDYADEEVYIYELIPVPAGTNTQIQIGGAWKEIAGMQIQIGGNWKAVEGAQMQIGGAWKTIF